MVFSFVLVLVQVILLYLLHRVLRYDMTMTIRTFGPTFWFGFYVFFGFVFPQLYLLSNSFELIQNNAQSGVASLTHSEFILTQWLFLVFLIAVTIGAILVDRRAIFSGSRFVDNKDRILPIAYILLIIGLSSVLYLFTQVPNVQARSELVGNSVGKAMYALSFFMSVGMLVLAAYLADRKKLWILILVMTVLCLLLLSLGGRGRALWPVVVLFMWLAALGKHFGAEKNFLFFHLSLKSGILLFVSIYLVLISMDPILLYWRGLLSLEQSIERFISSLVPASLFLSRNFDGFNNLSTILSANSIAISFNNLFVGVQQLFMSAYFPLVSARGIGIPATLPGGLYIVGGWLGVAIGGCVFGAMIGAFSRSYKKNLTPLSVLMWFHVFSITMNIGTSYLDSALKILCAVLPAIAVIIVCRKEA